MTSANPVHADRARKDPAMAHAPVQLGQDPQFEPFLYAPLGEDRHGSSVTVLSMLARLGVDPWGEASELSRLPAAAARQRLEALMTRFHDVPTLVPDRGGIVSGRLALLPRQAAPRNGTSAKPATPPQEAPSYWIISTALLVGLIALLAQGQ